MNKNTRRLLGSEEGQEMIWRMMRGDRLSLKDRSLLRKLKEGEPPTLPSTPPSTTPTSD
ncbi:hypothetical protein FQZ97_991730 [compost metagenome]